MQRLSLPPGRPDEPFILDAYAGENIYTPTSAGTIRNLVTANETNGEFLISGGGGVEIAGPVPFHYHKQTRHDFLCTKGKMKVWLNNECRVLGAGDYASVAPNTIHAYQFVSPHTENFGIVVPGGWENFFRAIGDVYDGPMWPEVDNANPLETLVPRVKKASEEFDVHMVPGYQRSETQPWDIKTDSQLRKTGEPYFLRNGWGPSATLGGTIVRPIATGAETDNLFTLGSIEGSSFYQTQVLSGGIKFPKISHCVHLSDGYITLSVDGCEPTRIGPAETAWIPDGVKFDIAPKSRYFKLYIYSKPGGLVDLLHEAGKDAPHAGPNCFIPEAPGPFERSKLLGLRGQFEFDV